MKNERIRLGIAVACALGLAACEAEPVNTEKARTISAQGAVQELQDEDMDIARLAAETLAGDLNIPVQSIQVDSVRAVDWRDSSLGCPQPDQAYLQVITPGHRIALRVDGVFYYVHEANGRAFVCRKQKPKAVGGVTPQMEFEWALMAMAARKDLAAILGVDDELIIVASAEGTTWSDDSLGCPESGVTYEQSDKRGYVLTLRYGSRNYTYHTDLDRVIACPPLATE